MGIARWALFLLGFSVFAATKNPIPERYSRWLNQDVIYIITGEERKAFLQLGDDSSREKFIEEFWETRNPIRGTKQNPYKEEHYRRLEYANQTFGHRSNTPGWQTDMGRTYILFGKPVSKVSFTGYGQIYPLELWFYENKTSNPSLPPFFYTLFFIPEDIGEYRFYRPIIDGPMKLVRGSQFNSNRDVYRFLQPLGGDIAHAVFSLIPNEPIDNQDYRPNMTGEILISKIENLANDSFNVKRIRELRALRGQVTSYLMLRQANSLDLSWVALADPDGQYWLDYSIWIKDEKLGRPDASGKNLMVSAGFRLATENGETIVEDSEERSYPAFEDSDSQRTFTPFQIANRLPLVPGKYRLEVQVTDHAAGKLLTGEANIAAGAAGAEIGAPLLIAGVKQAARPDATTPFQYFGVQFAPAVDRQFGARNPLRLLFQLHVPEDGPHDYQLEYVVAHEQIREARRTLSDAIPAREFLHGNLLKSKTIPITELPEGPYRVVVNLREKDGGSALASVNVPFKLAEAATELPVYFLGDSRVSSQPAAAAYVRALEALALKDSKRASEYLRRSLDRNSRNAYASQLLAQLYFGQREFGQVTALYEKLGEVAFASAPSLAQVSLSYWQTGKRDQARQVLETARSLFPKDPLLLAAAKNMEATTTH